MTFVILQANQNTRSIRKKIYRVLDNLLPPDLDAMGIWNSMQLTLAQHRPIKNSIIRIELSPSPEHTSFYDIEDWQGLWHEFAEEFDKQTITGKDGESPFLPTNLANSNTRFTCTWNPKESSPSPCCNLPVLMKTGTSTMTITFIFGHNVQPRRVAVKRGWKTAEETEVATFRK